MWSVIINAVFSAALFINAALFIPQAVQLYRLKVSDEVSFTTFFGFLLIQLAYIGYGQEHHDTLLVLGTWLSVITNGLVAYLIAYYRIKKRRRP